MKARDLALKLAILPTSSILLILLLMLGNMAWAQEVDSATTIQPHPVAAPQLQIGFAPSSYRGDLQHNYQDWNLTGYIGLRLNTAKKLNGGLMAAFGRITGENSSYVPPPIQGGGISSPNRYFQTNFILASFQVRYTFLKKERWGAFVGQGVGIIRYQPRDATGTPLLDDVTSRPVNELFSNVGMALPTTAGAYLTFPNKWGIEISAMIANSQTDYLDNIGTWGTRQGNDNLAMLRAALLIPLKSMQNK